jgi:hypothetical protein
VPGDWSPPPPAETAAGPDPGQVAASIATGVLCLWTPFTLIVALVLGTLPYCVGSRAAICTPLGHLAGMWSSTIGGALGLIVVVIGCWVYPRREHGLWALGGLALAIAGLMITVGLADTAPLG